MTDPNAQPPDGVDLPTRPVTACPACGSPGSRPLAIGGHTLRRCTSCHVPYAPRYVDPSEIYKEGYHSGGCGAFGVDLSHPEWRTFLEFVGERRIDLLERTVHQSGRILDVGCGTGQTLAAAQRHGWEAVGVDLVPSAVEAARADYGLDARLGTLEDSGLPEHSFDVVAATHVLEHQLDAMTFLSSVTRWVKPGGHLFIEVPNWRSFDRMGNRDTWYGLRPLEHMAHYSPRTLAATLRRVGCRPVDVRTPFYQFEDQSLPQALHDFGLDRLTPRLNRPSLTVPGLQRDATVQLPNARMRRALRILEISLSAGRLGVVVVMTARVP